MYQLVPINYYDKELTCTKTLRFIKSVNIKDYYKILSTSFSNGSVSLQVDDLS